MSEEKLEPAQAGRRAGSRSEPTQSRPVSVVHFPGGASASDVMSCRRNHGSSYSWLLRGFSVPTPHPIPALRDQWQRSDTDSVRLYDHDAPAFKGVGELREVGFKERHLLGGSMLAAVPKQDYRRRRLLADCKQRAEIGIGRNHDALFSRREVEDFFVGGSVHVERTDMHGIVTELDQRFTHRGRERVINRRTSPHERKLTLADRLGGITQRFLDVGRLEVRVGIHDLGLGHPVRDHP